MCCGVRCLQASQERKVPGPDPSPTATLCIFTVIPFIWYSRHGPGWGTGEPFSVSFLFF